MSLSKNNSRKATKSTIFNIKGGWSFGQGHLVIFESGTRLFAHYIYKYKYLYYSGGF